MVEIKFNDAILSSLSQKNSEHEGWTKGASK